jgi:hypothetical protein
MQIGTPTITALRMRWGELSVIQAAHAAEILIKARIAEEHPLLIFEYLPKPIPGKTARLELEQLIENGRTYQYGDLPDRLWATTGIKLPELDLYRSFGRLRNAIQHFTSPSRAVSHEAIEFIFRVIDPFVHQCWGLYAVDYNEDYEAYIYFVAGLIRRGVRFLVSPGVIETWDATEKDWPESDPSYQHEMETRVASARRALAADRGNGEQTG